jgi:hypothetical protein
LGDCLLWAVVCKFRKQCELFGFFFHIESQEFILTKNDWATFWATFSQTHLVTLPATNVRRLILVTAAQK